jgi:hypothetical protein
VLRAACFSAFSADFCCKRTNSSSIICGSVGDKRAGRGASGDFGGGESGEDSGCEGFLTTIVSGPTLNLEGVLCEEFLPDSSFFEKPDVGCDFRAGLLSRSAGRGDKRGGRSRGFSDDGLEMGFSLLGVSFFG